MNLNQRPSKVWIYLPLYLLALWAIVALAWNVLNPSSPDVTEVAVENPEPQPVSENHLSCFTSDCKNLSGVFDLWPDDEINRALNQLDPQCLEEVCEVCKSEARLVDSFSELDDDHCFEGLFEQAKEFHIEQIKSLPKTSFFYHSGRKKFI